MVERFPIPDGPRVFLLSLKAGGTGLNLTGANHVFHFDRWWNPAVENQATDRAFRIGQTRNVQVHKFVCAGTLEEKIDEMIERKKEVAGPGGGHRRGLADRTVERAVARPVRAAQGGGGGVDMARWDSGFEQFHASRPARRRAASRAQSQRGGFGESWWAKRWIGARWRASISGATLEPRAELRARGPGAVDRRRRRARFAPRCRGRGPNPTTSPSRCRNSRQWRMGEGGGRRGSGRRSSPPSCWPARCRRTSRRSSAPPACRCSRRTAATSRTDLLVSRLVESLQAHRGGLLPAGRGVRPRPVPDLPHARDVARRFSEFAGAGEKRGGHAGRAASRAAACGPGSVLEESAVSPDLPPQESRPVTEAALPRRLGKFPFWRGRINLHEFLDGIYARASAHAAEVLAERHDRD